MKSKLRPITLARRRSDSDGSAKIALIAMDRSMAAWAAIRHYITEDAEGVIDLIVLLDGLRQVVEKTFPKARSFVRPGFDGTDLNEQEKTGD